MTMITPSYLGETIEYSSLHACRSTLEDPTRFERPRIDSVGDSYREIKEHPSPDLPANCKTTLAIAPEKRAVKKAAVSVNRGCSVDCECR